MTRSHQFFTVLAVAFLIQNGCSRNAPEAVAAVQRYVLDPFPDTTVGEMVSAFFASPKWVAAKRRDGIFEIAVTGFVRFQHRDVTAELVFLGSKRLSTVVPLSLRVDGEKMTDVITYQFLERMYAALHPDSQRLVGEWVCQEVYRRSVDFRPDGTFRLQSWPWRIGGSYEVRGESKTIVLRPDSPLDPSIRATLLAYSFDNNGNLLLRDPDADIFLLSGSLVFKRAPLPLFDAAPRIRSRRRSGGTTNGSISQTSGRRSLLRPARAQKVHLKTVCPSSRAAHLRNTHHDSSISLPGRPSLRVVSLERSFRPSLSRPG